MADKQPAKPRLIEPETADQKPADVSPPSSEKTPDEESISIAKPTEGGLEKFRSKRSASIPGVETLLTALPHHSISQAKDFGALAPGRGRILVAGILLRERADQRARSTTRCI